MKTQVLLNRLEKVRASLQAKGINEVDPIAMEELDLVIREIESSSKTDISGDDRKLVLTLFATLRRVINVSILEDVKDLIDTISDWF